MRMVNEALQTKAGKTPETRGTDLDNDGLSNEPTTAVTADPNCACSGKECARLILPDPSLNWA